MEDKKHIKSFKESTEKLNISVVSDSKTQKNLWQNIFKELPYLSDKDNLKIYIKHLTDNYILTKK